MHRRSSCAESRGAGGVLGFGLVFLSAAAFGQEPSLPAGLGGDDPPLPVFTESAEDFPEDEFAEPGFHLPEEFGEVRGFLDLRVGRRLLRDDEQSRFSLGEVRLQTEWSKAFEHLFASARVDLLGDAVSESHVVLPDDGYGVVDVREGYVRSNSWDWVEVVLGRQILTWGTGDLLFLNDLFPKDYSYFLGRDAEYLKAPSDAVKVSLFSDFANLDVVYSPWFDPDRFPDGTRQSIYQPFVGGIAGRDDVLDLRRPNGGELDARLARSVGSYEFALYGHRGYWKSAQGLDVVRGKAFFPRMNALGASARGPQFGGISNVEVVYYDSVEDRSGDDPLVANSLARILVGHERTLATDLTLGLQYLLDVTMDHSDLERAAPPGSPVPDEYRSLYTTRLTYLSHRQKVRWSLFIMHSPTDRDSFARPSVTYDHDDRTKIELGANVLHGHEDTTSLGQLERTTNVYAALRFSF